MSEEKAPYDPRPQDERIEQFLKTLPRGIREHAQYWKNLDDGLLYPATAIRSWQELPSKTDDGRDIISSKSAWQCIAFTTGRGWVATALHRFDTRSYEVWSLSAFGVHSGPHIIDYEPELHSEEAYHGKKGRHTEITEQDVRDFAKDYVIHYYQLHPSNHHFIEIRSCGRHKEHYANWACRVNFSASGDIVTLLVHPTLHGLEVFAHEYEE